jgi:uncharacterized repeat protein (TIGR02543 family)
MSVTLYISIRTSGTDNMNHFTLNLNVIFKNRLHNLHSKSTIFSLVSLIFVLVLLFSSVAPTFTFFASGASDVTIKDETELRTAVNNAIGPVIIALTADITLTGSALNIPVGKDITLVSDKPDGFWKLIGASRQDTITIDGTLTLDGIIVTHKNGEFGRGVTINRNGGILNMKSGVIANNTYDGLGGGVYIEVYSGGIFIMSGGEIVNNIATRGGGVSAWSGSFEMSGNAIIANNTASSGGGVSVDSGSFSMYDKSLIADNTAEYGGGVYVSSGSNVELLGGKVSGNVASVNGGGVWVTNNNVVIDFGRLSVALDVVFESNRASVAYSRASTHDAVYNAQINSDSWTAPFTQGYNNYDISYTAGTLLTYRVFVSGNYSSLSGEGIYLNGTSVTVNAGSRSGYTFAGWTVFEGGITLPNTATATFTMPLRNVEIAANWTPTPDNGSSDGSSPTPSPSPSVSSEPTPSTPTPSPSSNGGGSGSESSFPLTVVLVLVIVVLVVIGVVALLLRRSSKV